jgi:hypothetical protein
LAVGSGFQRFPCPSTTSLDRAPYAADHPGPPRFRPRGFSPPRRFPGSIELAGLFHPAAVPGLFLPSERSPRDQVAHPSSGPLAPLPFVPVEPRCGERGLVTSGLHRLGRRSGVVPGRILPRLEAPFQRRSSHPPPFGSRRVSRHLPVTLDLARRTHLGPVVPSTSKRSSLRESVHTTRRSPVVWRPVLSWASSPLQSLAPAEPGALYPPRPEASLLPLARNMRLSAHVRPTSRIPVLRALLMACATSAPLLETLDVRWNRAGTTEASHAIRRRTPHSSSAGRAALRQQPRLP